MVTIIKFMQHVTGSEIILFGSILCTAFFILAFIIFKANRYKKAIITYLIILFSLFEACDIIWLVYFYPEGEYVNHGIVSAGIFLLFPLLCIVLNTICTIVNKRKLDENKALWETMLFVIFINCEKPSEWVSAAKAVNNVPIQNKTLNGLYPLLYSE